MHFHSRVCDLLCVCAWAILFYRCSHYIYESGVCVSEWVAAGWVGRLRWRCNGMEATLLSLPHGDDCQSENAWFKCSLPHSANPHSSAAPPTPVCLQIIYHSRPALHTPQPAFQKHQLLPTHQKKMIKAAQARPHRCKIEKAIVQIYRLRQTNVCSFLTNSTRASVTYKTEPEVLKS